MPPPDRVRVDRDVWSHDFAGRLLGPALLDDTDRAQQVAELRAELIGAAGWWPETNDEAWAVRQALASAIDGCVARLLKPKTLGAYAEVDRKLEAAFKVLEEFRWDPLPDVQPAAVAAASVATEAIRYKRRQLCLNNKDSLAETLRREFAQQTRRFFLDSRKVATVPFVVVDRERRRPAFVVELHAIRVSLNDVALVVEQTCSERDQVQGVQLWITGARWDTPPPIDALGIGKENFADGAWFLLLVDVPAAAGRMHISDGSYGLAAAVAMECVRRGARLPPRTVVGGTLSTSGEALGSQDPANDVELVSEKAGAAQREGYSTLLYALPGDLASAISVSGVTLVQNVEQANRLLVRPRRRIGFMVAVAVVATLVCVSLLFWRQATTEATNARTAQRERLANGAIAMWAVPSKRYEAMLAALSAYNPDGKGLQPGARSAIAELAFRSEFEPPHQVFAGQGEPTIRHAAFSPNGALLLTVGGDRDAVEGVAKKTARVWDVVSGRSIGTFGGGDTPIEVAEFSGDGSHILTSGNPVCVWNTATLKPERCLERKPIHVHEPFEPYKFTKTVFALTGERVAIAEGSEVTTWDLASGRKLNTLPAPDGLMDVRISSDGGTLALVSTGVEIPKAELEAVARLPQNKLPLHMFKDVKPWCLTRVFDATNGHLIATLDHSGQVVRDALLSHDGARLLVRTEMDRGDVSEQARDVALAEIWDTRAGRRLYVSPNGQKVTAIALGDNDRVALIATRWGGLTLHSVQTWSGRLMSRLACTSQGTPWDGTTEHKVWWTHQGAAGLGISSSGEITVCNGGVLDTVLEGTSTKVFCSAISPDGARLAACDGDMVRLWPIPHASRQIIASWFSYSDDGLLGLVEHEGQLRIVDALTGSSKIYLAVPAFPDEPPERWQLIDATFSSDTKRVAAIYSFSSSREDGQTKTGSSVVVWNASSGRVDRLIKLPVDYLTFGRLTPDLDHVLGGTFSGTVMWKGLGEAAAEPLRPGRLVAGALTRNGQRLARLTEEGELELGAPGALLVPLVGHKGMVRSVEFSRDDERLVTAGEDHTLRVWDALTGKPLLPALNDARGVRSAAFSPNGKYLVSVSDDDSAGSAVAVWDAKSGASIYSFLTGHTLDRVEVSRRRNQLAILVREKHIMPAITVANGVILFPFEVEAQVKRLCALLYNSSHRAALPALCGDEK